MFLSIPLYLLGKPNGKIAKREVPTLSPGALYAVQKKAWMDEEVMLKWVTETLAPYVAQAPEGIVPVLFLDSYRAHMMASVVERIQALGVDVFHIPGGCTGLCQPVDVGFNKQFKSLMRKQWDEWMISKWDQITAVDNTPKPTRRIVSDWVLAAYSEFSPHVIRNSWTKTGYAWFNKRAEDPEVVIVEGQEAEDEDDFVLRTLWTDDGDNEDAGDDDDDDDDVDDDTVDTMDNIIDGTADGTVEAV
jgi:hypothetical protein